MSLFGGDMGRQYGATARSSRASGPAGVGAGSPSPWGFDLRVEGPRDQAQEASGHTGARVGTHCMLGRQWTPRRTGRSRAKCANGGRAAKGLLYCAENRERALSKRLLSLSLLGNSLWRKFGACSVGVRTRS